ncbi:hydroxymethylpyrimidine/phosphomethylpyrimidine kinase [Pedobacter sp. P351]|uniref:hydroxymethylpyrimidine/phosphomethylpyrimidine kinase n=1 Tax=Pedobacter superstes TaxID=3133441 RepID=UPI00309C2291
MTSERPVVLSIAGFDPSGGAGILADIKTFEQNLVYGFGVLTANTFQTDTDVKDLSWIPLAEIKDQIKLLMDRWEIEWFKIGIIESADVLHQVVQFIIQQNQEAKFVWDPVLRSSSGFPFFRSDRDIATLLKHITVLTPNLPEFEILIGKEENALSLSESTMIYLKGGHREDAELGKDVLYWNSRKYIFEAKNLGTSKHGSGCILASAICSNLALNIPVQLAFEKAKQYIEQVLSSNPSLLGWHS